MFIRSHYNYDVTAASDEAAYVETMPSLTVQSMSEDADLNILMKRFGVTGKMPEDVRQPTYGDFTHITDYRSAIEASRAAEESFLQFPADIRAQFENDPQLFLDFVENPANIEKVKQWFPKESVNATVSRSSGVESPVRTEPNRSAASQNNASGDESAQRSGGATGTAASGK